MAKSCKIKDGIEAWTQAKKQARWVVIDPPKPRVIEFKPVGITTRYGSSAFKFSPSGELIGAGYTLNPYLQEAQNRLEAMAGRGLTEAEQAQAQYAPLRTAATGLFGLGQQYMAQTPEQVAADYMAKQQALLAPSRERQLAQLQNQLYQTGRGGLSVEIGRAHV